MSAELHVDIELLDDEHRAGERVPFKISIELEEPSDCVVVAGLTVEQMGADPRSASSELFSGGLGAGLTELDLETEPPPFPLPSYEGESVEIRWRLDVAVTTDTTRQYSVPVKFVGEFPPPRPFALALEDKWRHSDERPNNFFYAESQLVETSPLQRNLPALFLLTLGLIFGGALAHGSIASTPYLVGGAAVVFVILGVTLHHLDRTPRRPSIGLSLTFESPPIIGSRGAFELTSEAAVPKAFVDNKVRLVCREVVSHGTGGSEAAVLYDHEFEWTPKPGRPIDQVLEFELPRGLPPSFSAGLIAVQWSVDVHFRGPFVEYAERLGFEPLGQQMLLDVESNPVAT